ncbi:EF hand domain-containing protein [Cyclospora cayetanensis]|uniref:EF hand domain-containing protein n=1 Tax=Cyclospora cayetanensis TaxID=88456 RepID=A0A1D3D349_9EIME|nr:EF hand domain-containing protein [Cyclospora cayetanensis]
MWAFQTEQGGIVFIGDPFFSGSDALQSAFPREYRVGSSSCFEAEEAWVAPHAEAFFSSHFVGSQVYIQRAPRLRGLQAAQQLFGDWTRGVSRKAAHAAAAVAAATGAAASPSAAASLPAVQGSVGKGKESSPVLREKGAAVSSYSGHNSSLDSCTCMMRFCVWVPDASRMEANDLREWLPVEAAGPVEFQALAEAFEAQAARRPEGPTVAWAQEALEKFLCLQDISGATGSSTKSFEKEEEDLSAPAQTLVNLMLAPDQSPLGHLRDSLLRVEALSHILVWTQSARMPQGPQDVEALSCDEGNVDAIELPRLGVSFKAVRLPQRVTPSTQQGQQTPQVKFVCCESWRCGGDGPLKDVPAWFASEVAFFEACTFRGLLLSD